MEEKILHIESQVCDTYQEKKLLRDLIMMAKEAGYTTVHDHWGMGAYDTHNIDELITTMNKEEA